MKIEKLINKAKAEQGIKNDDPVVQVPASTLSMLFPDIKIKKVFFQAANSNGVDGWRLYFITEQDEAIVLPVNPQAAIHLLTKRGLIDDIKEFRDLTAKQKVELSKQLDKKEDDFNEYLKNLAPDVKKKKKAKKKKD